MKNIQLDYRQTNTRYVKINYIDGNKLLENKKQNVNMHIVERKALAQKRCLKFSVNYWSQAYYKLHSDDFTKIYNLWDFFFHKQAGWTPTVIAKVLSKNVAQCVDVQLYLYFNQDQIIITGLSSK